MPLPKPVGKMTKLGTAKAEAARLRIALIEAHEALELAGAALRGHQADYHYTSDEATELLGRVLARVKAALNE